ncbi:MAG TPA: DUF3984 domain-containing protein [Anaerolineales bacterium]|nr:DUF3984 domain-containing protein [Anaerolineales bacterium]
MLECPFCHEHVKHQRRDHWFECPVCQNWIRLRVSQNGSRWLEAGFYANDDVHPLRHMSRPASQSSHSSKEARGRASRPDVRQMDRETVQAQRLRVAARLRDLEQDIQRVITLRSENLRNEQLTSQFNADLSRYAREQNEWKEYERQLAEREHELVEEEKELARQARGSGLGLAFWFGTILSGAGIYAFSQLMGLQLDLMAYLYLALIAVISGFVTLIITKVD